MSVLALTSSGLTATLLNLVSIACIGGFLLLLSYLIPRIWREHYRFKPAHLGIFRLSVITLTLFFGLAWGIFFANWAQVADPAASEITEAEPTGSPTATREVIESRGNLTLQTRKDELAREAREENTAAMDDALNLFRSHAQPEPEPEPETETETEP